MKKGMIGAVLIFAVMLSACSKGITQSEYDQIVSEKESLQKEYDALQEEHDALREEYGSLQENYEKFEKEYTDLLNEKAERLKSDLPAQYAQAWVNSAFSEDGVCFSNENTLFVSILTNKEVNAENIRKMRSEFLSSIKTYAYMKKTTPDCFAWDRLSVTFYDMSGAGIFQFTIDTDQNATLKSILLNAIYADDLALWIQ